MLDDRQNASARSQGCVWRDDKFAREKNQGPGRARETRTRCLGTHVYTPTFFTRKLNVHPRQSIDYLGTALERIHVRSTSERLFVLPITSQAPRSMLAARCCVFHAEMPHAAAMRRRTHVSGELTRTRKRYTALDKARLIDESSRARKCDCMRAKVKRLPSLLLSQGHCFSLFVT